jgi:hypothetical protein
MAQVLCFECRGGGIDLSGVAGGEARTRTPVARPRILRNPEVKADSYSNMSVSHMAVMDNYWANRRLTS